MPASRIFRDKQSRRLFEELRSIKASCATTYEELERMHKEILTCKRLWVFTEITLHSVVYSYMQPVYVLISVRIATPQNSNFEHSEQYFLAVIINRLGFKSLLALPAIFIIWYAIITQWAWDNMSPFWQQVTTNFSFVFIWFKRSIQIGSTIFSYKICCQVWYYSIILLHVPFSFTFRVINLCFLFQ